MQSTNFRPISLRSSLILSSHSSVFPSDFPTKILYAFPIYPCVLCSNHLIFLNFITLMIYLVKRGPTNYDAPLHVIFSSLVLLHSFHPQDPLLKHPQSMSLPKCERPNAYRRTEKLKLFSSASIRKSEFIAELRAGRLGF